MSTHYCANCRRGNPPKAHYCLHCGQAMHQHRIDAHFIWHELQHGLLHVDKGIFFTIKELALQPGRTVREFLAGRRTAHFKPVTLLLLAAGTYTLLRHFAPEALIQEPDHDTATFQGLTVGRWLNNHLAWFWLLMGPLVAWAIQRLFRRFADFNLYEVLVLVLYLTGETFVLLTATLPVRLLLPATPYGHTPWYYYPCLAYLLWGIWQFYEVALPRPWPRLGRAVAGMLLAAVLFALVLLVVLLIALLTGVLHAPEAGH